MSSYEALVGYVKQLERRLAKLERLEGASGITDHGALTGLGDDDHSIYALLAGRSGGQSLIGGTAANDDLTLEGTSNATRDTSYVILQPNGGNVGIGTSTPASYKLDVVSANVLTMPRSVDAGAREHIGGRDHIRDLRPSYDVRTASGPLCVGRGRRNEQLYTTGYGGVFRRSLERERSGVLLRF